MRLLLRFLITILVVSSLNTSVFGATLTFLKIYKGTGTGYGLQTSSIAITTPVTGSNFKFTSANPADVEFSGNNIAGQLTYIQDGNMFYINGVVTRKEGNSNNKGFYFAETTVLGGAVPTGLAWFFLVPGQTVSDDTSISTNSSPPADALNAFLTSQSSNDAPVITSNGSGATASISINEGATAVTTVSSTDADGTTDQTYSITGGLDASKFSINSSTGALTITAQDYENPTDAGKNNSYEVQVTVTDSQGATDVQYITVNILDVNDNAPVITSNGGGSSATVYVTAGTTSVTDNNATDADNDVIVYSITNAKKWTGTTTQTNTNYDQLMCDLGDNFFCPTYTTTYSYQTVTNPFQINTTTGVLSFTSNATVNKYQITVTASDGHNTDDTQVLTVEVTSTDTQAPSLLITASDSNLSAGETTTVYFKFSEAVQGFASDDIALNGGTLGALTQDANDPTLYYATFTQTGASPSVTVANSTYKDMANNNGTGAVKSFDLDTIAPGVTVEISTVDISYGGTRTVTFTFTEDPGLTFTLTDIQATNGTMTNLVQTANPLVWTATLKSTSSVSGPTVTVPAGSYRDAAGNSGTSGSDSATLSPPAVDLANTNASDTGESDTDNYTSNNKPVIVGLTPSTTATVTVVVTQGATTYTYTGVSVSSQQFSLDLNTATVSSGTAFPAGGLSDGTISLLLTAYNSSNTDLGTASSSFIIDSTAPATPTVTTQTTDNSTPTISGTATVGDKDKLVVVVNGVSYVEGDGNLTINRTNNTWSLTIPVANALSAATYSVIATVTDLAGNSAADSSTGELVISPKVSAADGNWGIGGSWNNTATPSATSPVQIQHNIAIPSGNTITSNTILLTTAGKLSNAGNLTINGNLVLSIDENSISSQFTNTGTVVNNGKIIIRKKFTKNKWYYMSFPFDVASNQIFKTGTSDTVSWGNHNDTFDSQIYIATYDGAARATSGTKLTNSQNWKIVSPRVLKARHGYFIALDPAAPMDEIDFVSVAGLSAPLNNEYTASEIYKNTSNVTNGSLHSDWNIVGLPYMSSYQLQNLSDFKPYYIFTGSNWNTVAAGDSKIIYPFSAFYLQASSSANSLSFASAGRTTQAAPAFNPIDEFKLSISYADMTDETRIRLKEVGTLEYQYGIDATKMFSPLNTYPQIYSVTNGLYYSLNALPQETQQTQLNIRTGAAGTYSIKLVNVDDIQNYTVVLTDKLMNQDVNLTENPDYQFTVNQTGTSDRFVISYLSKVIDNINNVSSEYKVSVVDRAIKISELPENSNLYLYDLSGKLMQVVSDYKSESTIRVPEAGIYILRVQSQNDIIPIKVLVK